MWTVSCIVVISAVCLSWTSPSHAGSLGRIIGLHAEVNQMSATLGRVRQALDEMVAEITCPRENFTRFQSSCYHFSKPLTDHGNDWAYARAICRVKGSDLVSIESQKEADFLLNNIVSGQHYWTSGHKHGSVFVWEATGANVTNAGFSPWAPIEPNTASNECAYLYGSNGKLKDLSCASAGHRYICETRL